MPGPEKKRTFLLLDANNLIHRAYHALPPLRTKEGELVNAVYGFLLFLFRAINDYSPQYLTAAFDLPLPTFRHLKFVGYKAKRRPTPEDLKPQICLVKEILGHLSIPFYEKEGIEADDVIATIAAKAEIADSRIKIIIISGDIDILQLVGERVVVLLLKRGIKESELYDLKVFKEKYQGLFPAQLVDLKALGGDPSDNISGVKGIGKKTAFALLKDFNTIKEIYQAIKKPNKRIQEKVRQKLQAGKKDAFLSFFLATIKKDPSLAFDLEKCRWQNYNNKKELRSALAKLEFFSLIKKIPGLAVGAQAPAEKNRPTLF